MTVIRRVAAQITTRRRKLAVGLLVALAGSGGLAARAWQDGPAQANSQAASQAKLPGVSQAAGGTPRTTTPLSVAAVGQSQWTQPEGGYRPEQAQSPGPGVATSPRRFRAQSFPTQTSRVSGFASPSWRSNASSFFSSPQSRESAEIDAKIRELINSIRRNPDNQADLGQELEKLLAKQFDMRHAAQTQQVDKMKASLAEAEETLAKRKENRDQIIERRAQQLLGQSDPLGWEYRLQTGTPSRPDSSLAPSVAYGVRLPQDLRYGVPLAPQTPSSMVPRSLPPQAPVPVVPPAQSAPGSIQSGSQFPSAASGGDQSDALVMKAQLDAARENLRTVERLHAMKAVSSSEFAAAKSQMLIIEAKLKGSCEKLKLECESARIDLEAERKELELLTKESRQLKEGSSEAYSIRRLLSRSEASLRKAELQLVQKLQQLDSLSEIVKILEKEEPASSSKSKSDTPPNDAETSDPEAASEANY